MEKIHGVLAPVVTPFTNDYGVDYDRLLEHCLWLRSHQIGIAALGTNSEANSLSPDERQRIIQALIDGGVEPAAMMPGTGACDLPTAISLTSFAVKAGCAGVLTLPPFYYKGVSDEGLFNYYAGIVEGVDNPDLRLYLYHIPQVSQVPISLSLVERLLRTYPGQIAGIKDSSGDWDNTAALIREFSAEGFDVFPGSEDFLLQGLRHGAVGCISATANVNPGPMRQLLLGYENPNADEQQAELSAVRAVFQDYVMIASMKAAIAHWRNDVVWQTVRPPLVALTDEQARALIGRLEEVGFSMSF